MLHPGQEIAAYTLLRRIGAGGAAEVWAAQQRALGVRVALKLLRQGSPALQARLRREGRAQAALSHPNLLPLRDLVELPGGVALVLPLVEGPSLAGLMERRRPSPAEGLALMRGVAAGVAHAHARGFLHRDLKPSNVLLDPQPTGVVPRVADFGLVKEVGLDGLTREGALLGTLQYAAPEQLLDAAAAGPPADVFSLGVMLFELLTGEAPFAAGSLGEILAAHRRPPKLGLLAEPLRPLLGALLARDPAGRPPDAAAVEARLRALAAPDGAGPLGPEAPLAAEVRAWWRELERAAPDAAPPGATQQLTLALTDPAREPGEHLPAERDAFFGRADELSDLAGLLASGGGFVTLIGPGGAGKTRLAQRHAWGARDRYSGGAWFCDLSDARELHQVCAAVASALGVALDRSEPLALLGQAIAGRGRCLMILDNFEQVVAHAADTVGTWVAAAPAAAFLITSRARLDLPGERVLDLAPLDPVSAVELFVARAQGVRRGFDPDDEALGEVGELVALLDHLPLAIELAAARTRVLSPAQLRARLGDRFRLLTSRGGRSERHATLRGALDWSWALLGADEQAALAQLSTFEGGFSLEAAEAVIELGEGAWPLDVVQSLVDKSLVAVDGGGRLRLLVTVQEYARERLQDLGPDASPRAEARHGGWFRACGRPAALARLRGPGGLLAWRALAADSDNLVAAARRAAERGDGETASLCALAAWAVTEMRGPVEAGIHTLSLVSPIAGAWAGEVHLALGQAFRLAGRSDVAIEQLDAAEARFQAAGDHPGAARARARRAGLWRLRQHPGARAALEAALAEHEALGDAAATAEVLAELGRLRPPDAAPEEAAAWLHRALDRFRSLGDRRSEALALDYLGQLHASARRSREAIAELERARALHAAAGNRSALATLLGNLGVEHFLTGDGARARETFVEALRLQRLTGRRPSMAFTLMHLGNLCSRAGEHEAAMRHLEEALTIAQETRGGRRVAHALANLAGALMEMGRFAEARARLDEARAHLDPAGPAVALGELELIRAQLCVRVGEIDGARRALAAAEDRLGRAEPFTRGQLLDVRAELARAEGDLDRAEVALAELAALVDELGMGPGSLLGVQLARGLADLAGRRGAASPG